MSVFPAAEDDGCAPLRAIAAHLNCNEDNVHYAFAGVPVPEWEQPGHLDVVKTTAHELNTAARYAQNLLRSLRALDEQERLDLIVAGCITVQQVEHLAGVLSGNAESLTDWLRNRSRTGGRNPAAYAVSEGMRRLFRRRRRRITYGLSPSGDPSTEFCRAVEFALGAFGIRADWRGPARAAHDKQLAIQNRLQRAYLARHHRQMQTR